MQQSSAVHQEDTAGIQVRQRLTTGAFPTITGASATLAQMDLGALAGRCHCEGERFLQGLPFDERFAHELFRRALVERDEAAWEQVYQIYYAMVKRWVLRSNFFVVSGESCDSFVNMAFTRFWQAIPPQRFAAFPTLAALLRYLRRCAQCAVIDIARAQKPAEPLHDAHDCDHVSPWCVESETLDRLSQQEFWRFIATMLSSEAERVVIMASFIQGMKPGAIYAEWPDLFATIDDVYRIKRAALDRLGRCQALRLMAE